MNKLTEFHNALDASDFDATNASEINKMLQGVNTNLHADGEEELLKKSDLERQAYEFVKTFNLDDGKVKGISWKMSGTIVNEKGEIEPMVWPDISKFTKEDFEYIEKRYKEIKNLYAKTELGLILYFQKPTPFSHHNEFKKELCNDLLELSKIYKAKSDANTEKNFDIYHFINTVKSALKIAIENKFADLTTAISQWLFEVHNKWDLERPNSLRILLDITNLITDDFKVLKGEFDIEAILRQNLKAVEIQEKQYIWGAIHNIDISAKLDAKAGLNLIDYRLKKAQLYEALANQEQGRPHRQLAVIQFVENALRIYKAMKDEQNTKRLEDWYQKIRGTGEFGTVSTPIEEDQSKAITDRIDKEILQRDKLQILELLSISPMFSEIEVIKNNADQAFNETLSLHLFPTGIMDKYGNTIANYNTDEEKLIHAFWQTFDFDFQMGVHMLMYYFFESHKNGKLDFDSTIEFLEKSWLNEPIERNYNGRIAGIIPLDIIKPPLKLLFDEFNNWYKDNSYPFNAIVVLESLTLKIEATIRFLCERIGIVTFRTKEDGVVMEKNLDEMLADLQHKDDKQTGFEEKDRLFIKFVLSEKSGLNLRNKVAHGLLDINEYAFEYIVIVYSILIRFARYKMK